MLAIYSVIITVGTAAFVTVLITDHLVSAFLAPIRAELECHGTNSGNSGSPSSSNRKPIDTA